MNLLNLPHHDGSAKYVSSSKIRIGDTVQLRVRVPNQVGATKVRLRYLINGEQQVHCAKKISQDEIESYWQAEIKVVNPIHNYRWMIDGGDQGFMVLNAAGVHYRNVPDAADFKLVTRNCPDWVDRAVVYQIFPDRFAKSSNTSIPLPDWAIPANWDDPVIPVCESGHRQLYGGNLDGIIERLGYLCDLGVNVIYLTPFFPGHSNHRYDGESFDRVDPVLGGDEALIRLVDTCHKLGMKVLGDITTNHTGVTHEWFKTACQNPNSAEYGYYFFTSDHPGYHCWNGIDTLPTLNYSSEMLVEKMFGETGVIKKWLTEPFNLDGWRVDVANMTGRVGESDLNQFVQRTFRNTISPCPDEETKLIVAEHCYDLRFDLDGLGWHGAMNYSAFTMPFWAWLRPSWKAPRFMGAPLHEPRLSGVEVMETVRDFAAQIPFSTLVSSFNLLGSHDTTRIMSMTCSNEELICAGLGLLFTLPGIPMITYGDEIGLTGEDAEAGRKPFPWDDESSWSKMIYRCVQVLTRLYQQVDALRSGGLRWISATSDALLFTRETSQDGALVLVSRAEHASIHFATRLLPGVETGQLVYGDGIELTDGTLTAQHCGADISIWRYQPTETFPTFDLTK